MSTFDECNCDACRAVKSPKTPVVEAIDTFRDANEQEALREKLKFEALKHRAIDAELQKVFADVGSSADASMLKKESVTAPVVPGIVTPISATNAPGLTVGPLIYRRGETLFNDAAKAINGERQTSYGDPEDSFDAIAVRWTQYLRGKGLLADGAFLVDADTAFMMADFKMARECFQGKRDNRVDVVGYLGILDDLRASS